jgi:hypothetical protein
MANSRVERFILSDDVQKAIAESEELDESYRLLNVAADYYRQYHEPMTLEAALTEMRRLSAQIEALG